MENNESERVRKEGRRLILSGQLSLWFVYALLIKLGWGTDASTNPSVDGSILGSRETVSPKGVRWGNIEEPKKITNAS